VPDRLSFDCNFASRFVYWTGGSGRRYIHTVYEADACPPLPGGIYVSVVRGLGGERKPVAVGRFAKSFALSLAASQGEPAREGRCEIHVHLLAESDADGENVLADLRGGLNLYPLPARAAEVATPRRSCPADGPLASGDVIELYR
jgi:hypothetical protein